MRTRTRAEEEDEQRSWPDGACTVEKHTKKEKVEMLNLMRLKTEGKIGDNMTAPNGACNGVCSA
jgi:hypothetical protein